VPQTLMQSTYSGKKWHPRPLTISHSGVNCTIPLQIMRPDSNRHKTNLLRLPHFAGAALNDAGFPGGRYPPARPRAELIFGESAGFADQPRFLVFPRTASCGIRHRSTAVSRLFPSGERPRIAAGCRSYGTVTVCSRCAGHRFVASNE